MSATEELRNSPPHGQKREAEDDLESEQRLAKRFNLLNLGKFLRSNPKVFSDRFIDQNGKLYIPVQATPQPPRPPVRRSRSNAFSDSMNMDDSRDRIFIHNLDDELADLSSDEEKLIFLPDIEKRFTKIPSAVLASDAPPRTGNEVILYSVPSSITVPQEQDNVRKAIIESRERAREHALEHEHARQMVFDGKDDEVEHTTQSQGEPSDQSAADVMDLS